MKTLSEHTSKSLIISFSNLELGKSIGQGKLSYTYLTTYVPPPTIAIMKTRSSGEFGIVYKALLKTSFDKDFSETVAVKMLKGT